MDGQKGNVEQDQDRPKQHRTSADRTTDPGKNEALRGMRQETPGGVEEDGEEGRDKERRLERGCRCAEGSSRKPHTGIDMLSPLRWPETLNSLPTSVDTRDPLSSPSEETSRA